MVKYTAYNKEDKTRLVVLDMPNNEKTFPMDVKDKACSEGWLSWGEYEKLIARKAREEDIQRFNEMPLRELIYFCHLCKDTGIKNRHSEDGIMRFVDKETLWGHLVLHHNFDKQTIKMIDRKLYEISGKL